jgi:3-hydroxyacyl-CoA dehydrogenase
MKQLHIRKAAVLGAGVMGAQIAAHFANAKVPAIVFDLAAKEGDPSSIVAKALENLKKLDPAPLAVASRLLHIEPANYDQHLPLLKDCDLVVEAIAERIDWKKSLYEKIAPHLAEHAIVASNTSGLSITTLSQALPEKIRPRFCGVHFFNPPRYMHLVELIRAPETDATLLDQLETFLTTTIGKGVVRAKDTPNFIANRVGIFSILATIHHAKEFGLGFDVVDALTGKRIGRPKSATFRTADVVGLDTFAHVVNTMRDTLPDDPWHSYFAPPQWLEGLIDQGALGAKTKAGIYRKVGKEIQVLDLDRNDYRPSSTELDDEVKDILKARDFGEKLSRLRASNRKEAQFLWALFRDVFHYCAFHLESIADNARDLDLAIRWGFGWDRGPFEIWQSAGWQKIAAAIQEDLAAGKTMANVPLPQWVFERTGVHSSNGSYSPAKKEEEPRSTLPVYRRQLYPDALLGESVQHGTSVFETDAVRLWHAGDDIAILSFKSKMHAIGEDVLDGTLRAIDEAEANFAALVIWQTEPPFSVGANLLQVMQGLKTEEGGLKARLKNTTQRLKFTIGAKGSFGQMLQAMKGGGPTVESVVAKFQQTTSRLRYSMVPTIAAVQGMALGGGCEFAMHCDRVIAALESYIGLVEVGVGLIPAGGGCKEFALRASEEAKGNDVFPFLQKRFQTIAMASVAKSAEHAKELGLLRDSDVIVMNHAELLYVAKSEARGLADVGYRPPLPSADIRVAGKTGIATAKMLLTNMLEGGFISQHDYDISAKIANVLCGGEIEPGSVVDEDWLLTLERDAFVELLASDKTQARIEHMLKTGKPLRN